MKVVIEAFKEQNTLSALAEKCCVHSELISRRKTKFLQKSSSILGGDKNVVQKLKKVLDVLLKK